MRLNAWTSTIRGIPMAAKTTFRGVMSVSALASVMALAGCGAAGGVDFEFDAPILNAAGINLTSKKKDESDLPERPGLVVPPSTSKLPEPGERRANAEQNWPDDPDVKKKNEADAKQAARDKYCAEGDWSGKGGISEYDKALGREQRCPSKLGESVSKTLGGRPAKDE